MKKHTKIALAAALLVATTMAFVLPKISAIKANEVQPMTNLGESEKSYLVETDYRFFTVEPSGQLPGGMTGVSSFIITPNGETQSFTASVSLGVVSVSVPINKPKPNYTMAIVHNLPNDGGYYKVYIDQRCEIKTYRVDQYKYSQFVGSYYRFETKHIDGRVYHEKVR